MPHKLFVGKTSTGKSSMAKLLAKKAQKKGVAVYVYSTLHSTEFGNAKVITDFIKFIKLVFDRNAVGIFIIDEADLVFKNRVWADMLETALTKGRHFGSDIFLITQRPAMIDKTARSQCSTLYCCRIAGDDKKAVEKSFGIKLDGVENFDNGVCYVLLEGQKEPIKLDIFNKKVIRDTKENGIKEGYNKTPTKGRKKEVV